MDLKRAAYHEASHAVVAWRLGMLRGKLSLTLDSEVTASRLPPWEGPIGTGSTGAGAPDLPPGEWVERVIALRLAGMTGVQLAEELGQFAPGDDDWAGAASDIRDMESVVDWLGRAPGAIGDPRLRIMTTRPRVRALLEGGWPAVEALALVLLDRYALNADEAAVVIGHAVRSLEREQAGTNEAKAE